MKYKKWTFFLVSGLFFQPVLAVMAPVLIDKVCFEVGNQEPGLRSEVLALAKKEGISPKPAQVELIKQRILQTYAKQKLKFNLEQIKKAAQEHVDRVREKAGLSLTEFKEKLKDLYHMTLTQFVRDTEHFYLKSQVMAELRKQVVITEDDLQKALRERLKESNKGFDVVFISIKEPSLPSADLAKEKAIKKQITLLKSLDKVKTFYENDKSVSFSEPSPYKKGNFLPHYEAQLQKYEKHEITEPFSDNGKMTMIWKIRKNITDHKLSETALEKERNSLYEEATKQLFDAVVSSELANSPVISNCDW